MSVRLLLVVAALTGLASFVYEIAWIRMLSLVLGASTHAFELMLASFILGLALGGAWIRRRIDRLASPRRFLGIVQVAMGLAALASIVLYSRSFDAMAWLLAALTKTDGGYLLFNLGSAAIAMAIMLPATFAAGMTLPLITFILLRGRMGERAIGTVYAWNTAGAIAGVLVAVHVGLPQLGVKGDADRGRRDRHPARRRAARARRNDAARARRARVRRGGRRSPWPWRPGCSRSIRGARSPASTAAASRRSATTRRSCSIATARRRA